MPATAPLGAGWAIFDIGGLGLQRSVNDIGLFDVGGVSFENYAASVMRLVSSNPNRKRQAPITAPTVGAMMKSHTCDSA